MSSRVFSGHVFLIEGKTGSSELTEPLDSAARRLGEMPSLRDFLERT